MSLTIYPAWRSLVESLQELALLLRRAGADLEDLAAQADLLVTDPVAAAGMLPDQYRIRFSVKTGRAPALEAWEMESQLSAWLAELARHMADVPLLLELPGPSSALGQALAVDLPRAWGARLAVPLQGLRQTVRGAVRGSPASPPSRPLTHLKATVSDGDLYHVVLPASADDASRQGARRELVCHILRDLGLDAARLHLLLAASPGGVPDAQVRSALGLTGAPRAAAERAYAALSRLRRVQLSLLTWEAAEGLLAWERRPLLLWDVAVQEYGQACLDERSGALAAHGTRWSFTPSSESWAPGPPTAPIEKDDLSQTIAVLLSLAEGDEAALPNRQVCELARRAPDRNRLKAAARRQRAHGWEPDFSGWPAPGEDEGEGDLAAAVTRYRRIT